MQVFEFSFPALQLLLDVIGWLRFLWNENENSFDEKTLDFEPSHVLVFCFRSRKTEKNMCDRER